jgi:hypothetical protein
VTTLARALLPPAATLVAGACGLLGPEQLGDLSARVIVYGAVTDSGRAPAPAVAVYGRGFRDDCTQQVTANHATTTDVGGRYRLVLDALSTGFRGCVEISLDGAAPPPWLRMRGVPFRERAPLDSFRVNLVRDAGG